MNKTLALDQFNYQLADEAIAQRPLKQRDLSKLLVIDRHAKPGQEITSGRQFKDLPQVLATLAPSGAVLVRNNTKVIPARIIGMKPTQGKQELLLLKRVKIDQHTETWECLSKPGLKVGVEIRFPNSKLRAKCTAVSGFSRLIKFNQNKAELMTSLLEIGQTPIPPYIEWQEEDEQQLRQQYQTVYAKIEGSAAAPTAGLHFTPELNRQLKQAGVLIEEVTLHVGLGTFQPVKTNKIQDHQMHSEWYQLEEATAKRLNRAKADGKKIIAVGTTTTRVLETCSDSRGQLHPDRGETDIFITPGYKFKFIDGLITNFHLPQSTLLMLVSALVSQPNTKHQFSNFSSSLVGQAYELAKRHNYRFYSFGDSMIIL